MGGGLPAGADAELQLLAGGGVGGQAQVAGHWTLCSAALVQVHISRRLYEHWTARLASALSVFASQLNLAEDP